MVLSLYLSCFVISGLARPQGRPFTPPVTKHSNKQQQQTIHPKRTEKKRSRKKILKMCARLLIYHL